MGGSFKVQTEHDDVSHLTKKKLNEMCLHSAHKQTITFSGKLFCKGNPSKTGSIFFFEVSRTLCFFLCKKTKRIKRKTNCAFTAHPSPPDFYPRRVKAGNNGWGLAYTGLYAG